VPAITIPPSALTHRGFRDWVTSDSFPGRINASYLDGEILIEMGAFGLPSCCNLKRLCGFSANLGFFMTTQRFFVFADDPLHKIVPVAVHFQTS